MARERDYRAERERRNDLARQQGFTSHDAVTRYLRRERSRGYSATYTPRKLRKGENAAQVARAHYDLFKGPRSFRTIGGNVMNPNPDDGGRHYGRRWFVDIMGIYTNEEYDQRYGWMAE